MLKGNFNLETNIVHHNEVRQYPVNRGNNTFPIKGASFQDVLDEKLKFSRHAEKRMNSRNLELNEKEVKRLENAIERARNKGSRESLILMDDKAFFVSIKNNTVITAMADDQLKENVFTNIDSTVIS